MSLNFQNECFAKIATYTDYCEKKIDAPWPLNFGCVLYLQVGDVLVFIKGAPQRVMDLCNKIYSQQNGTTEELTEDYTSKVRDINSSLAKRVTLTFAFFFLAKKTATVKSIF